MSVFNFMIEFSYFCTSGLLDSEITYITRVRMVKFEGRPEFPLQASRWYQEFSDLVKLNVPLKFTLDLWLTYYWKYSLWVSIEKTTQLQTLHRLKCEM